MSHMPLPRSRPEQGVGLAALFRFNLAPISQNLTRCQIVPEAFRLDPRYAVRSDTWVGGSCMPKSMSMQPYPHGAVCTPCKKRGAIRAMQHLAAREAQAEGKTGRQQPRDRCSSHPALLRTTLTSSPTGTRICISERESQAEVMKGAGRGISNCNLEHGKIVT